MKQKQPEQIVEYKSAYKAAFKNLNQAWIEQYFKMESSDYKALDHPETYIINNGGAILFALVGEEVVGTCALIKFEDERYDYDFELAKMAVAPAFQGRGIGYRLASAAIEKARQLGAASIYLESSSILQPALNLYKKLGFKDVKNVESPYERCNVQMELILDLLI